jgi:DNA-binding LacI/PurR family transcriptional regulator
MTTAAAPRAATLVDVADLAQVSRQTVSNVINAPQRVAGPTRDRVQAAIDALSYRPHRLARNLRTRTSRMLGYRVPTASAETINPLLDRFLHALTDAARVAGYHVLLFTPDEGQDEITAHTDLVATGTVDGFVLAETNYHDPRADYLAEAGVPFVAFGRTGCPAPHDWVDVDGAAGTQAAVARLVAAGHSRIAFLGWPVGSASGDQREHGWRRGLAAAGLGVDENLLVRGTDGLPAGAAMTAQLLGQPHPPTAVVATSDLLALGALQAARTRGLAVGRDLAIVGFDDSPVAGLVAPPLTSVRQPIEEVGRHIVALLTSRLAGRREPAGVLLAPRLIVRRSA